MIIKPPTPIPHKQKFSIFLAGSIEMGSAVNWQEYIQDKLADQDINIYNPRRDDWDSSWKQTKDNKQFREQVEWELSALDSCDTILMYFDPNTKSPISLLELGLFADSKKLIVCCPDGFWRKGNVDIVCEQYNIPQTDSLDGLIELLGIQFKPITLEKCTEGYPCVNCK